MIRKSHQWMLKLNECMMRTRMFACLKIYPLTHTQNIFQMQRKNGDFTIEKPDRHHHKWSMLTSLVIKQTGIMLYYEKHNIIRVVYFPKTHNLNLIIKKYQTQSDDHSTKLLWLVLLKMSRSWQIKKWGTVLDWRRLKSYNN